MKRSIVLCLFLIVIQVILLASPVLAEGPVEAQVATANASTGLSLNLNIVTPGDRLQVGDRVTVNGSISGWYTASAMAAGTTSDAALAGAVGGFGWMGSITDPSGNRIARRRPRVDTAGLAGAAAVRTSSSMQLAIEGTLGNIAVALALATAPAGSTTTSAAVAEIDEADRYAGAASGAAVTPIGVASLAEVQGTAIQNFSVSFVVDQTGTYTIRASALAAALAGSALVSGDSIENIELDQWAIAWSYDWFRYIWELYVFSASEWKPVGEHIVFTGLPANTWWADLRRLEMNGNWTYVPPLQPAGQLPSPVHADLMIHGYGSCTYAMRICNESGGCQPARYFTVKWTGSEGVNIFDYPGLSTSSPVATTPTF